jgi:hypothetical protein
MRYLWEIYILYAPLIYLAMILAGVVVVIAIWRGMKAQERMADSVERIEEIIRRGGQPRV